MKDNFSSQSDLYKKFRPTYPQEFFSWLESILASKQNAWDCGTGNGQVAAELSHFFENVYATDISAAQIEQAKQISNIHYSVQPAEETDFPDNFFDLIIVAQAIHWFNFEKFYKEARRTAKKKAIICAIGYGRLQISPEIDAMISDFYKNVIGKYWDAERRYVDENYETIPFPFEEIAAPKFENKVNWNLQQLFGYLHTWSAVKHFIKENNFDPLDDLQQNISEIWKNDEEKTIEFPLLLRIGKINP